jgi:hypothetical protein
VGDTEAEALAKAVEIEAQVKELAGAEAGGFGNKPQSHAAERQQHRALLKVSTVPLRAHLSAFRPPKAHGRST